MQWTKKKVKLFLEAKCSTPERSLNGSMTFIKQENGSRYEWRQHIICRKYSQQAVKLRIITRVSNLIVSNWWPGQETHKDMLNSPNSYKVRLSLLKKRHQVERLPLCGQLCQSTRCPTVACLSAFWNRCRCQGFLVTEQLSGSEERALIRSHTASVQIRSPRLSGDDEEPGVYVPCFICDCRIK